MRCLIVGAGPAGSTLALLLAREGAEVLVVDRARFPREKACGEFLSPLAVRCLSELGLLTEVEEAGAVRVHSACLCLPRAEPLEAPFEAAENGPPPFGATLSRRLLDPLCLRAAERSGAQVRLRFRAERLERVAGAAGRAVWHVQGRDAEEGPRELEADLLVGADGVGSLVARRLFGLRRAFPLRIGISGDYSGLPLHPGTLEMHLQTDSYCGVVGQRDGIAHVGLAFPLRPGAWVPGEPPGEALRRHSTRHPHLAERLAGAAAAGSAKAFGPMAFQPACLVADGALLVGDAAGFVDPVTGHGIGFALRSAMLAAETAVSALREGKVERDRLKPYARAYRDELGPFLQLCRRFQRVLAMPAPSLDRLGDYLAGHPTALRLLVSLGVGLSLPQDQYRLLPALLGPGERA